MATEFERDLAHARTELEPPRQELLAVVGALTDDDLDRERRGGWSVRRVLEHVIQSEWLYVGLVSHLRDQPVQGGDRDAGAPSSATGAIERLRAAREALLKALEGVDEESFYRLRSVGHEEYSVLSLLENVALHDREHEAQVREIIAATTGAA